ncbi:MAG: hypothetical protein GQ572_09535 [Gammaproteobacteria bacterium]|nr:hypothetical protein [Gammaproteobacteria bacterium]
MNLKKHIILFFIAFFAWLFFFILGYPSNYFLDWSVSEQVLITLITLFGAVPWIGFLVIVFFGGDYFKTSLWFSFYASVPLFLLDFIVVGLYQGQGFHYLITHWYITIAYFYVWIELPLIGQALRKLTTK